MKIEQLLPALACCLIYLSGQAQSKKPVTVWPAIKTQTRPWTRWWWMGNAVDEKNIRTLLNAYKSAGIGGVEITPIYGAVGFESRYLDFLSPKWMGILNFTTQTASQLHMGVDMNTGTGWPFGGPQIKPADAATRLIVQTYELPAGQALQEPIKVNDAKQKDVAVLQAVIAYDENGQASDVTGKVDGSGKFNFISANGKTQIYAVFAGKTLQKVKRAAPGGEGYTLDHLAKPAVDVYLNRFTKTFNGSNHGVRSFFNDSYEVYNADWSPALFEQFQKDHHYDLRLHIRDLTSKEKNETIARIKSDYRETMNGMLLHNFTQSWTNWAHGLKSLTKNQSHGSPGNLLDLYGAVDIPECETFGSSKFDIPGLRRDSADVRNVDPDPIMFKFASSAAHVNGKPLVSSETFTWLTEHFKTSFSQCKPEVEQLFLSGVNHVFFHGTTYSPEDAKWPGWLFYASMNVVPSNSLWPHLKGMNDYITRCQSVLQAGRADNEVLMYWPVYDVWNNAKGMDMALKVHDIDQWLVPTPFYKNARQLQQEGYGVDFASDNALLKSFVKGKTLFTTAQASYKVLIIPECELMPVETLQQIIQLAKGGTTVIFQQLPKDVPGFANLETRRQQFKELLNSLNLKESGATVVGSGKIILDKNIVKALSNQQVLPEELTSTGLQFIRRDVNGNKYYYIVNHTANDIDTNIPLNCKATSVVLLDPLNGNYGKAAANITGDQTDVHVQLKSGEALIIYAGQPTTTPVKPWPYLPKQAETIALKGPWNLQFTQGGPTLPSAVKLSKLTSWTELADTTATNFSGTGVYTSTFTISGKPSGEYVLDLGQVDESAHVWINGKDAGIIWSIPFKTRVSDLLKAGQNEIKVEVCNLMANRIRYTDRQKIEWRNYHEINFVNIDYKPFNAANWKPMPSGLIGPVKLVRYRSN